MSTDPRNKLKNLLSGVTATIDDGVTAADILVMYGGARVNLKHLFHVNDYDVVITIDRWDERRAPYPLLQQNWPQRYEKYLDTNISAIDKTGLTATKVLTKVRDSVRTQIQAFGLGTDTVWFMEENRGEPRYVGGIENVWVDTYRFFYREADNN